MSSKFILCLIILAQFACVSAIFEIISHWFKKKDKHFTSFTLSPRGTGEANAKRGWK